MKKILSTVVSDPNDENNFLHKLLLTNKKVLRLRKAFANGSSANIKYTKTQLHKIGESGWLLGRLLGPLLKTGLPLIKNVLKTLAKSDFVGINSSNISNICNYKPIIKKKKKKHVKILL